MSIYIRRQRTYDNDKHRFTAVLNNVTVIKSCTYAQDSIFVFNICWNGQFIDHLDRISGWMRFVFFPKKQLCRTLQHYVSLQYLRTWLYMQCVRYTTYKCMRLQIYTNCVGYIHSIHSKVRKNCQKSYRLTSLRLLCNFLWVKDCRRI